MSTEDNLCRHVVSSHYTLLYPTAESLAASDPTFAPAMISPTTKS